MDDHHSKGSDFFAGLLGVAVIGLLVAVMLFGVLTLRGGSELEYTGIQSPAQHTVPQPGPPPVNVN